MITISRSTIQKFRAVYRKSVGLKANRVNAEPVILEAGPTGITLSSRSPEVQLRLQVDTKPLPVEKIAFTADNLIRIEGRSESPVTFESVDGKPGKIRFDDRGIPQLLATEANVPDYQPPSLEIPSAWSTMPPEFLRILDDASHSASREDGKFVTSCLQLRGSQGEIIATDQRQLLIHSELTFPFREEVLVPALPVFGVKELTGQTEIRLGRTESHVVVETGPWRLELPIDTKGRFPEVHRVIPSTKKGSTLEIHETDALFLLASLDRFPSPEADPASITLDLKTSVTLRAALGGSITEIVLSASTAIGPELQIAINRPDLERALKLGFRSFYLTTADKPVLAKDAKRSFVFMSRAGSDIVLPDETAVRIDSASVPVSTRSSSMSSTFIPRSRSLKVESRVVEPIQPLIEAERAQAVVIEVIQRTTRLIVLLSASERVRSVVRTAVEALRKLATRK